MICKCSWRKKAVFFLNSGHVYIDSYLHNSSGLVHVHSNHNFPENLYPRFLKHEEQASSSWFLHTPPQNPLVLYKASLPCGHSMPVISRAHGQVIHSIVFQYFCLSALPLATSCLRCTTSPNLHYSSDCSATCQVILAHRLKQCPEITLATPGKLTETSKQVQISQPIVGRYSSLRCDCVNSFLGFHWVKLS